MINQIEIGAEQSRADRVSKRHWQVELMPKQPEKLHDQGWGDNAYVKSCRQRKIPRKSKWQDSKLVGLEPWRLEEGLRSKILYRASGMKHEGKAMGWRNHTPLDLVVSLLQNLLQVVRAPAPDMRHLTLYSKSGWKCFLKGPHCRDHRESLQGWGPDSVPAPRGLWSLSHEPFQNTTGGGPKTSKKFPHRKIIGNNRNKEVLGT